MKLVRAVLQSGEWAARGMFSQIRMEAVVSEERLSLLIWLIVAQSVKAFSLWYFWNAHDPPQTAGILRNPLKEGLTCSCCSFAERI